MSPKLQPVRESSVLGESWVVASSHLEKEEQQNKESSQRHEPGQESKSKDTKPTAVSSGPDLVMPSIYEVPISEQSWIAPNVRSRDPAANTLKRRHEASTDSKQVDQTARRVDFAPSKQTNQDDEQRANGTRGRWTLIRMVINLFIMGLIFSVVAPELLHHYPILCNIPTIPTLYPTGCSPTHSQTNTRTRYEAVTNSQTRLESLFNDTLQEMTNLTNTLTESESLLHDIHKSLQQTHPTTKHELDLEFEGCVLALRDASKKFDTLHFDIRSALDSLRAMGGLDNMPTAADSRVSTQMRRRKQYIDQLIAQMRPKADSLFKDLTVLDDHLESISSIVDREKRVKEGEDLKSVLFGLPARLASFFSSREEEPTASTSPTLAAATVHHRPVAQLGHDLSSRLQVLQLLI